eukprot:CAMPEP_0179368626 /NCGR_PEP_ID=MMETSP0797-20121207/84198_1 /TAXON_ID=47934 /ORGANISM="Dinophysis acuminata, Strain DAEP01" /LENGTH=44 /DNA_ID= /DNA_START= /DNA_END= /DNA_ORIENTATION=
MPTPDFGPILQTASWSGTHGVADCILRSGGHFKIHAKQWAYHKK